jgi:hypothetical protein
MVLPAALLASLLFQPSNASAEQAAAAGSVAAAPATRPAPLRWGDAGRPYRIRAVGEVGFLAVADHHIQFGSDGTDIDYVSEGGQENLYLAWRLSVELALFRQHQILFLYQPLQLATDAIASRDLVVDELTFPEGSPVEFTYGFPFYRLSYLYDIFADPRLEVSVGVSLQIRNATIVFSSGDGALYRSERDIGFVPLLKLRVMYALENGFWFGTEIDGIYAPVSYLNGSDNEIVGALVDWSLRAGLNLPRNVQAFLNVRYLGGGATGTNPDDPGPGDGYVRNWLHFLTVTLGVNWDII